jgi:nucleotide-binding universal stress UspA family protein
MSNSPPSTVNPDRAGTTILLPALNPDTTPRLATLAAALAAHWNGSVLILGVIVVPEDRPLSDGAREAPRLRAELDALARQANSTVNIRTAVSVTRELAAGIRTAVNEHGTGVIILGWQADQTPSERFFGPPIDDLMRNPPADLVLARLQNDGPWPSVLLPVRGGPHTRLAYDVACAVAAQHESTISLLYAANPRLHDEAAVRAGLQELRTMPHVARWIERHAPPEQAILEAAPEHSLLVLGVTGRISDPEAPIGPLADRVLRHADSTVLLVRHRMAQAEEQAQEIWQTERDLSATVDRWFAENTFTSAEFDDLERLVALKRRQNLTISLALPALNEEETIGDILRLTLQSLVEDVPLLDEVVLIDSRSTDRTREIAEELGVPVHIHQEILPQYGAFIGKGEALWKSLYVLKGDLIVWCDTDIKNFHPRFIYGVVGPLLHRSTLMYCKGFYRRPIQFGELIAATGGGRVTELTARPLLNLFYPELSGMIQPLSGEYAGRRSALERVPFFTGYGVEIGMLIDLLEQQGLSALAQVDLHQRIHRNQELEPLSRMAFAITQVVMQRMEQRQRVQLLEPINQSMKLITYADDGSFHLNLREIRDHERPPMAAMPEYRQLRGM